MSNPVSPAQPLRGVRVLDFTRILSGPYCTLLLADMGADVVKVERSDRGDDTRSWGPPFLDVDGALSSYFAALNRGKRSFAIDFRAPGARELLLELAGRSDVVVENFRAGVAEQLGLDWATISARNPRAVVCSISGFGRDGRYAHLPATEIVVEGMSGLMEVTGPSDGDPVRFGIAMVDIATGLTAATRIVAALMLARQTGRGTHLDCSLYATAVAALGTAVAAYSATGDEPRRWGSHHGSIVPYGAFPTADGHVITGVVNDAMWPSFCEVLELPELAHDPRFLTNADRVEHREELHAALGARCGTRTTAQWVERLRARGLLAAPIRSVGDAVDDPATAELGLLVPLAGFPGVYSTRLAGPPAHEPQPVPRLGEHTREVLAEIAALAPAQVDELIARGAVADDEGRAALASGATL